MPNSLKELLLKYQAIFALPSGLPPSRVCDHKISPQPNSFLVKVSLYLYPHSKKIEIECMLTQMLNEGIIEQSNGPFSLMVLLVKKKDGSWRFCIDYRALNVITIKDAFPIPMADELLDKLYGAQYFFEARSSFQVSSDSSPCCRS